jgi:hypothetical protein
VSSAGGVCAAGSSDGRELFHREGVATMAVTVDTSAGPRVGIPRRLFSDRSYVGTGGDLSFDAAQDGRFLMVKDYRVSEFRHSVVVSNRFDDLTRHVGDASR